MLEILKKPLEQATKNNNSNLISLIDFIDDAGAKIDSIRRYGDLTSLNSIKEVKIKEELNLAVAIIINSFVERN